jgi:hypothetical protein
MKRKKRASLFGATAVLVVAIALPAGAAAAGSGAVVVRGIQLAYGTCGPNSDGYQMTGDLEGCWWITEFDPQSPESRHNLRATGTEHFDGRIGSLEGTFDTFFQYTAKFDGPWVSSAEIHGRCHHPIVAGSGTGDFAGITGQLSFHDGVDVDPPYYPYWGSVRIPGAGSLDLASSTAASASRTASAATTASSC